MSVMSDKWIAEKCNYRLTKEQAFMVVAKQPPMIHPFTTLVKEVLGKPVLSYGLSSYGYDVRVADEFKLLTHNYDSPDNIVVDPKNPSKTNYIKVKPDVNGRVVIPPNGFMLCHTVEYIRVPRDILVVCIGKSTYARLGLVVNVTPLEPDWEGQVTIEISNTTNVPVAVYANEGIAQFIFMQGNEPCLISYADRKGKYQGQMGITEARM